MQPVHVFRAAGLKAFNVLIALLLLVCEAIVVARLVGGLGAWVALPFLGGGLPAAVIWMVVPRRFEIWPDRLVIVFPVVYRWSLGYDSIESVAVAKWWHPYAMMGTRLASHPGESVDIMRRKPHILTRPNIVISPEKRHDFVARINEALEQHRSP